MSSNSKLSVNIVVLNGEKYIPHCLEALLKQSGDMGRIALNILDNGSHDGTKAIIREYLPRFGHFAGAQLIESSHNFGPWGGWEELLKHSASEYVVFLSADVIVSARFLEEAIRQLDADTHVGAIQAKVYQFSVAAAALGKEPDSKIIDTCGFQLFRSRRLINIGHGEQDHGQYDTEKEIFGVEGAVPVFRKSALESIRVMNEIADHDLFWYAEDFDVAWRLRLAGWKEIYDPKLIAWHDRQTTKSHSKGSLLNYVRRVPTRQQVPLHKRRLGWSNTRFTIIKNDYIINILKDLPYILWRELEVLGYTLLFEPGVFAEVPRFFKLLPRMLKKRKEILGHAKVSAAEIHRYFA